MIKAVIFDFDGTLADTIDLGIEIGKEIMIEEGYEERIPEGDLKQTVIDLDIKDALELLPVPKWKVPLYFKKISDRMQSRMNEVSPYQGVKEVIGGLAEDYRLAVLSSNKTESIRKFLEGHGWAKHFDEVIGGVTLWKKAGRINKALKSLDVEPGEAVYVGDGERDVDAAHDNQVKIISVTWGYNSREVLEKKDPDFMVDEPQDIIKTVRSLG